MIRSIFIPPTSITATSRLFYGMRAYSTKLEKASLQKYLHDPVKVTVIPITDKESFIYYKHTDNLFNSQSRILKAEKWIVEKAAKLWRKLKKSPKSYNKKIVSMVQSLLNSTPWSENSLLTIPSESYILKRIKGEKDKTQEIRLTLKDYTVKAEQVDTQPLHVYYPPGISSPDECLRQMKKLYQEGLIYHKKWTLYCLLGLPLTIPLILIPLIPNVPGFYLSYRAYVNIKAYLGAKHLKSLLESSKQNLEFRELLGYTEVYKRGTSSRTQGNQKESKGAPELLLNKKTLPLILDFLEVHELESDLNKVILQESKSQEKNKI
ncbi:BDH_1b_G0007140.mRNA.1.CDS.1 [Saccharomyces cerevisiae]|nr:BDH_1b_G0007140.mRNA.1.CDS.1 [Saccharomyces cerevisiae]CAI7061273.1 BDH_1b_G0007140.mRNA.1.CDS.1 [Saccharomyces cerevisiae]